MSTNSTPKAVRLLSPPLTPRFSADPTLVSPTSDNPSVSKTLSALSALLADVSHLSSTPSHLNSAANRKVSRTVRKGNKRSSWGKKLAPPAGRQILDPASHGRSLASAANRVVFPAPDGPRIARRPCFPTEPRASLTIVFCTPLLTSRVTATASKARPSVLFVVDRVAGMGACPGLLSATLCWLSASMACARTQVLGSCFLRS
mmetsp:Transcript_15102/g.42932  ORF Transcript_15102/g.42932 Transcript_15102/m.42932 type:complete len:203 (-) Transcript_15102:113-721(-)